jgi:FAD/FMN-containing dehydrogenase
MLHKDALAKIVGAGNVLDDEATIGEYSSDLSFAPPIRAARVVKPGSAGEVQEIVKLAIETKSPLVPVSSGSPHFRGDTVPATGGAVIVDLSRMNGIMRIDRRNRICMIEPGVTFGELVPRLQNEGLRLNMPLFPRSSKSVIGSMLEREPVTMPLFQWDAVDPLGCVEVVFGSGDVFRTGNAAGPGTLEEQWKSGQAQVMPMGPSQTDFGRVIQGSQGTIGIVTWTTVRCEAMPVLQEPFFVGSQSFERLMDLVHKLLWLKMVDECLLLNGTNLAAIMADSPDDCVRATDGLPPWVAFLVFSGNEYFPEERIEYQKKGMREAAKAFSLKPVQALSGMSAHKLLKMAGSPADQNWNQRRKGACHDIFFLTTLNRVPEFVTVMGRLAEQFGYPLSDMGIYVQPVVQGTSCHCEFSLFYDPGNPTEVARIRDIDAQAVEALMNAGAFFSRPYGEWADMVYRRDGEIVAALRKVKSIFDPENIMNPGKLCF